MHDFSRLPVKQAKFLLKVALSPNRITTAEGKSEGASAKILYQKGYLNPFGSADRRVRWQLKLNLTDNDLKVLTELSATPDLYKDYTILPFSHGFVFPSDRLIRIASFLVTGKNLTSVFAFNDGGVLLHMSHPELNDEDLLDKAVDEIKHYIDTNRMKDLEEHTFHFYPTNYLEVKDPSWWTKTLKEMYLKKPGTTEND